MLVKKIQSHWATTVRSKFTLVFLSQILTQSKTTGITSVTTGLETWSNVTWVFTPFLRENVLSSRRYRKQEEVFNHISKLRYASSLKALFRYLEIWWSLFLRDAMSRILHWTGSFSPRKEEASTVNYFRVKLRLATTCRKDREVLWPQAYGVRHGWSIRATTRLRRQEMPCNTPTIRFQLLWWRRFVRSCLDPLVPGSDAKAKSKKQGSRRVFSDKVDMLLNSVRVLDGWDRTVGWDAKGEFKPRKLINPERSNET